MKYLIEDRGYGIRYIETQGTEQECLAHLAEIEKAQHEDAKAYRNGNNDLFTYTITDNPEL